MDWAFAIERNREALKRVLLALVAMAGLAGAGSPFSPCGRRGLRGAESDEGCARPTLPRHRHRAVLRLLRPAEWAARRLVVMAAQGLVVTPPRPRRPKPAPPPERASKGGRSGPVTGIWTPPHLRPQADRRARPLRASALPLFDPLPRMRDPKATVKGLPRLCIPGWSAPAPVPVRRPPAPDDAIDAARLALRLQALASALDDLPREARRFARWRMRLDAAQAESRNGAGERQAPRRLRRVWPLKPGRPPGVGRKSGLGARPGHAIDDILSDTHAFAVQALEGPDTS